MKKIYVDCLSSMVRAAVAEDSVLCDLIIDDRTDKPHVGDIYIGRVEKILPDKIAFVNIGYNKPVFLQLTDFREKNTVLKSGGDIAVQVIKEEIDDKRAVVTTELSIDGKYAVAVIGGSGTAVSKKIKDTEKRSELKTIGEKYAIDGCGLIMRTNCADADEAEIAAELEDLKKICADTDKKIKYSKAPAVIRKSYDIVEKAVRDLLTDGDEVIINDSSQLEKLKKYDCTVTLYDGSIPIFSNFFIESQIEKLLGSRVWLKCGGWLDIDFAEAMTVIDVNSGKYNGNPTKVNREAALECARQIRLRNLSGIIIIDFINIKSEDENKAVFNILTDAVKSDRVKTTVVGMTQLGLMELTRQKLRRPLHKVIMHTCPICGGTGCTENMLYTADRIRNQIINIFSSTIYKNVVVSADKKLLAAVDTNSGCKMIEEKFGGKIKLNEIETMRKDYFNIEKFV